MNSIILIFCCIGLAANAAAQLPVIDNVDGAITNGSVITITGTGFTQKLNPKPLLFWSAETGVLPSDKGRKLVWDSTFSGAIVDAGTTNIIAPGSTKSLRHDYSLSAAAVLSRVTFDSNQLYVWRKRYDDFDRKKDFAIRTRFKNLVSLAGVSTLQAGMLMSNADRSVFGKIISVVPPGSNQVGAVYYSNQAGNVADKSVISQLKKGDLMYFYAENDGEFKAPLFSALNEEGAGIYHTFNHKIIRLWAAYGKYSNNTYISLDSDGMAVSEHTQVKTYFMSAWDNKISSATERWVVEEFEYQAGSLDAEDGILNFWQDRIKAWEDKRFRFITTQHPNKYRDLYQTQVSNGAYPGAFEYFDSLYVDDTWHRVLICEEKTWFACKQPEVVLPIEWSDSQIKAVLRLGGLHNNNIFYFYVVNALGIVNSVGYPSCPKCPEAPLPSL